MFDTVCCGLHTHVHIHVHTHTRTRTHSYMLILALRLSPPFCHLRTLLSSSLPLSTLPAHFPSLCPPFLPTFHFPLHSVMQKMCPPLAQNIITIQPPPATIVYNRKYGMRDHFLFLSILLSFMFFFCGCWSAQVCTIPAIFFALSVSYVIVQLVPKAFFNYSVSVFCL